MCVGSRSLYFNESSSDVFYVVGVSWVVGEAYSFIGPRLSSWPARSLPVLMKPTAEHPARGAMSGGYSGRWCLHLAERLNRSWLKNGEEKKRSAHSPESMTPGGQVAPCGRIKASECVYREAAGGLWDSDLHMPRGVSGKWHIWQMDWKGKGKESLPVRGCPSSPASPAWPCRAAWDSLTPSQIWIQALIVTAFKMEPSLWSQSSVMIAVTGSGEKQRCQTSKSKAGSGVIPGGLVGKALCSQCRGLEFDLWSEN